MKRGINKFNSCDGKIKYKTRADASQAALNFNRAGSKRRMEVYKCDYCECFHFGHSKKKKDMKSVTKERRSKKRMDPKTINVKIPLNEGYCLIKHAG